MRSNKSFKKVESKIPTIQKVDKNSIEIFDTKLDKKSIQKNLKNSIKEIQEIFN